MGTGKGAGSPEWSLPEVGASSGPRRNVGEAGHALRAGQGPWGARALRSRVEGRHGTGSRVLLTKRPAVSRRCLRRAGGAAATDRERQRGHGSPQGLRAPGERGHRRALGRWFMVVGISPRGGGRGLEALCLGARPEAVQLWPKPLSRLLRKTRPPGNQCCVRASAQERGQVQEPALG